MGDEGEGSGMLGKFGAAFGKTAAKAGKKAAQSEAGRRATGAAVKGACDGVRDDMMSRYGSPSPTSPAPPTPGPTSAAEGEKKSAAPSSRAQVDSDNDDDITSYSSYSTSSSYQSTSKPTYSSRAPPKPSLFNKLNFMKKRGSTTHAPSRPRPRDQKDRIYKMSLSKDPNWDRLPLAQTLYNFKGEQKCDLEFRKGQVIQVITRTESQNDWWEGKLEDRIGIFPANYVKMM